MKLVFLDLPSSPKSHVLPFFLYLLYFFISHPPSSINQMRKLWIFIWPKIHSILLPNWRYYICKKKSNYILRVSNLFSHRYLARLEVEIKDQSRQRTSNFRKQHFSTPCMRPFLMVVEKIYFRNWQSTLSQSWIIFFHRIYSHLPSACL